MTVGSVHSFGLLNTAHFKSADIVLYGSVMPSVSVNAMRRNKPESVNQLVMSLTGLNVLV